MDLFVIVIGGIRGCFSVVSVSVEVEGLPVTVVGFEVDEGCGGFVSCVCLCTFCVFVGGGFLKMLTIRALRLDLILGNLEDVELESEGTSVDMSVSVSSSVLKAENLFDVGVCEILVLLWFGFARLCVGECMVVKASLFANMVSPTWFWGAMLTLKASASLTNNTFNIFMSRFKTWFMIESGSGLFMGTGEEEGKPPGSSLIPESPACAMVTAVRASNVSLQKSIRNKNKRQNKN